MKRRSTKDKSSSGGELPEANRPKPPAGPSRSGRGTDMTADQASSSSPVAQTPQEAVRPTASPKTRQANQAQSRPSPIPRAADTPSAALPIGEAVQSKAFTADDRSGHSDTSRPTYDRIAQRAYALYEAGGYEEGRALEHWLKAEREVSDEEYD
ncbi:MAG TPA: DUF2934 domain-containing protein [Nitrospiraceae bacterium]|nr:DUF2934 domain-containing protein [Nitrospiraceae bacterium]